MSKLRCTRRGLRPFVRVSERSAARDVPVASALLCAFPVHVSPLYPSSFLLQPLESLLESELPLQLSPEESLELESPLHESLLLSLELESPLQESLLASLELESPLQDSESTIMTLHAPSLV